MEDQQTSSAPSPSTGQANAQQQSQTAQPSQAQPIQRQGSQAAATAKPDPAVSAKDLAKLMAENRVMASKLKEFEATQGKEAQQRQEAEAMALQEKHTAELAAATQQAENAMASARRNAIKAHFRGTLKAETYLALMPAVSFSETGDLSAESVAALDEFRAAHQELFVAPSSATTPLSAAGASSNANGISEDMAAALRMNRIPLPGEEKHWSNRKAANTLAAFVGHNRGLTPWKAEN